MGIRFDKEPPLEEPVLIAGWPGIGNVGIMAVDSLRRMVKAEQFAEIEPWDFFYPSAVSIRDGELKDLGFPANRFYFKRVNQKDLILFIGEEQLGKGKENYEMANLVLDVAVHFGCKRVYTAAAAVTQVHHTLKPMVWAVPNSKELIGEVKRYDNVILMSAIEEKGRQGNITGLNGLLVGVAKKRGLEGICLLGEIPLYISQLPISYPKASKSILEVLADSLGVRIDLSRLDSLAEKVEMEIEKICQKMPPEIRERIDQLKYVSRVEHVEAERITEEDKKRIIHDIDEFFKKRGREH